MKRFITVLMSAMIALSMMPALAFAADDPVPQVLPTSGELSGEYSLTGDTELTGTITVPAGKTVTITGNDKAKLTLGGTNVIEVKGHIVLRDVIIDATNNPGWGAICLTNDNADLTVESSLITQKCNPSDKGYSTSNQVVQVANNAGPSGTAGLESISIRINDSQLNAATNKIGARGICFCDSTSGVVTVNNSKIYCNSGELNASYTRGIGTYQDNSNKELNINISNNTEIKGFSYPIFIGGGMNSKGHVVLEAIDSTFSGWSCAEMYGNGNKLDFKNCKIEGTNIFTDVPGNAYSLFQSSYSNEGSRNEITLNSCEITSSTKDDTTAKQKIVNFEDDSSVINFRNGTDIKQQDSRATLFQVWDSDGADSSNAKQFTFDDSVTLSGGKSFFMFVDAPYETATVCDSPDAKLYQGDTGVFTYAPSLGDAIVNANAGDTVVLINNVNLSETVTIDKDVTINLNGHNIKGDDCRALHIIGGNVKITGEGAISSNVVESSKGFSNASSVIRIGDNSGDERSASLTIDKDVRVTSDYCYGLTVFGSKTKETVVIDGTVSVKGEAPAVSGNGSSGYGGTNITVNGTVSAENDNAIYHPQAGTLTINGTITGKGGIEAKSGNTEVSIGDKANITATANTTSHVANSNGCSSSGYAIAAVKNDVYAGNTNISIKGGRITGPIDVLADNNSTATASIVITGGTFSSDPSAYVADEYVATKNGDVWNVAAYVAPTPTPEPEDPITNTGSGDNTSTNVDASDNTTTSDSGKTETTIDSTLGDKIVENAKDNNVADVVIKAGTEKGDSTGSTVALSESTVQALAKETEASVTIKTDSAEVSLDKAAVDAVAAQAGTDGEVKLVVETVENTADTLKVELKLVTSKGTVTDFQGGNVKVTVPVSEELAGKKLVCVYIDDNGKYIKMDGSLAADGKTFTFTTGHFSTYAILSEEEANAAIDGQNISKATVSGLANKTYTGKAITQKLTVKAGDKALVEGTDYTVSYSKNVNVGVASVKITGKGKYEGTLTKTFKINPKGTSISKVTGQKKAVKVVWKKQLTKMKTSYVSGYQVQYSTSSKFTSGTSKYANAKFSKGRTTKTIKNLKSGKKYYVRVRTYKSVDGTKCYSSWSKTKSVKTK